jgi:hypothetical protein
MKKAEQFQGFPAPTRAIEEVCKGCSWEQCPSEWVSSHWMLERLECDFNKVTVDSVQHALPHQLPSIHGTNTLNPHRADHFRNQTSLINTR